MRPFTFAVVIFFSLLFLLILNAFNTLLNTGERGRKTFFFFFFSKTNLKVKEKIVALHWTVGEKLRNQEFDTQTTCFCF